MPYYLDRPYNKPPEYVPRGARRKDYDIKIVPVIVSPVIPQEYYWHLYYRGDKVNGGICGEWQQAKDRASQYREQHMRDQFMRLNMWDEESSTWLPRGVLRNRRYFPDLDHVQDRRDE